MLVETLRNPWKGLKLISPPLKAVFPAGRNLKKSLEGIKTQLISCLDGF
jgi:hypothetical protein